MQSCNEAVIKKAVLLTDMHLKSLRQKCALVQMMKDASKKLEVVLHKPPSILTSFPMFIIFG